MNVGQSLLGKLTVYVRNTSPSTLTQSRAGLCLGLVTPAVRGPSAVALFPAILALLHLALVGALKQQCVIVAALKHLHVGDRLRPSGPLLRQVVALGLASGWTLTRTTAHCATLRASIAGGARPLGTG